MVKRVKCGWCNKSMERLPKKINGKPAYICVNPRCEWNKRIAPLFEGSLIWLKKKESSD